MQDEIKRLEARRDQLMKEINDAPAWGAGVSAKYEEVQAILKNLELAKVGSQDAGSITDVPEPAAAIELPAILADTAPTLAEGVPIEVDPLPADVVPNDAALNVVEEVPPEATVGRRGAERGVAL